MRRLETGEYQTNATGLTRRSALGAVATWAVSAAGCGYALAGRGNSVPNYVRTIGVPMFGNRTPYSPLEQIFTEKVRVEFQGRGRYQVMPVDVGVDAVVRGDLINIGVAPVGFNANQQASRYRFTVTLAVSFIDQTKQATLWENPALSFSDEYELASAASVQLGAGAFIDQERAAVERLSSDVARSVVSAILEAF